MRNLRTSQVAFAEDVRPQLLPAFGGPVPIDHHPMMLSSGFHVLPFQQEVDQSNNNYSGHSTLLKKTLEQRTATLHKILYL